MKSNQKVTNHSGEEKNIPNKPDLKVVKNDVDSQFLASSSFYLFISAGIMGLLLLITITVGSGQKVTSTSSKATVDTLADLRYSGESCNKNSDCMSDLCAGTGDFNLNGRIIKTCRSWFLD
jgi:hypothetical protein